MNISIVKIALNWSLSAQLMSWISSIKEKLFLILTCKNRFAISLRTFFPRVQTPCLVLVHDKLNFIISSLMHPELVLYINYCFRFSMPTLSRTVPTHSLTTKLRLYRRTGRVGASGQRGPQPSHHPGRGRKCDAQVPGRRQAAGDVLCLVQECEYYMSTCKLGFNFWGIIFPF